MATYDCIVLGVGGFGSSAVYHLAKRGVSVLGIEQHGIAHDLGSSHGDTRVIRKAYFEHPSYVPLLHRAYECWDGLQQAYADFTNANAEGLLWNQCGLLSCGPAEGIAISGTREAISAHRLPCEELSLAECTNRFPGFDVPRDFAALFEPEAGYLFVERCVEANCALAQELGATIKTNQPVIEWKAGERGVQVKTTDAVFHADQLIITAGAWASRVLKELSLPLRIRRKSLFWHKTSNSTFNVDHGGCTFLFEMPYGVFYGFPSIDAASLKLAEHSGGEIVDDPDAIDRSLSHRDTTSIQRFIAETMPSLHHTADRHCVCMYTMTPDEHFIIDHHPNHRNVILAAGFSGHGFKFTSSIGEALTDLSLDGMTELPIDFLSLARFQ